MIIETIFNNRTYVRKIEGMGKGLVLFKVEVVDNQRISVTQKESVLEAIELAKEVIKTGTEKARLRYGRTPDR